MNFFELFCLLRVLSALRGNITYGLEPHNNKQMPKILCMNNHY